VNEPVLEANEPVFEAKERVMHEPILGAVLHSKSLVAIRLGFGSLWSDIRTIQVCKAK
jgi:hypothetical protein